MRLRRTGVMTAAFMFALPGYAHATAADTGAPPSALTFVVGVVGLVLAALLLVEMLSLRKIAEGSAVASHISYAVLAVVCLAAAVLTGWVAGYVPDALSAAQASLGADILVVASMAFFAVYFLRVRRAMSRFLKRVTGEEQLVAGAIDPEADAE